MKPERYRRLRSVLDRRQPDLTVLVEEVNKTHNFSAILRSCDAAGVLEAHVVPPRHGVDLDAAVSAGSAKWVDVRRHQGVGNAAAHLKERGFRLIAAHPDPEARDYRDVDYTTPSAILMGAELYGLSDEALGLVDATVVIPMEGMVRSLNVSVATALLLYEARRQREDAGMYATPRLDPERYRSVLFRWAYPRLARELLARGEPYPDLDDEGAIV